MTYTYSVSKDKVYCMSHYAGKTVRGVAKCDPHDDFDLESGKKLAKARCDYKVAKKKLKRSAAKVNECNEAMLLASNRAAYYDKQYQETLDHFVSVEEALASIEAELS